MDKTTGFEIDEEKSVAILTDLFSKSGLNIRKKRPDEEGGFFTTDKHGTRRKLSNEEVFDVIFDGIVRPTTN